MNDKDKYVAPSGSQRISGVTGQGDTSQHPCILIYDDDTGILILCGKVLAKSNYRVETLRHCENVIADVERMKPDVILMNLWIPPTGGEKAVIILKGNPGTKNIPVLLFSTNAEIKEISEKIHAEGSCKSLLI